MSNPGSPARFCTECGSSLPPQAKFCAQCGTRVEAAPPEVPSEVIAVPPELREKYESARKELRGDRREVAVLFADVKGFTTLSERLDPEEVGLLMQRLLGELADVVNRYEGYVDKYMGDAIMALFGAPIAHENDAERAVLAALDMLDVVNRRDVDDRLALRVGVNLGEVVAAHLGSEAQLQYTVMGDAVNVASRLEGAAQTDTVLISGSLYERIASRFEAEEVPPLTLKGKSQPIQAYRVLRFRGPATGGVRRDSPYVGREEELEAVEAFLARIPDGRAGALLIEADAGAGKSRIMREAIARAGTDLTLVEVGFTQIRLPGQLNPAADLFRQLVALGPDESASEAARRAVEILGGGEEHHDGIQGLIAQAFPEGGTGPEEIGVADPRIARQNRWVALAALMSAVARRGPVLIVLEDIHWVDEEGEEFLAYLLPALAGKRVGVVVTSRPEARPAWLPASAETLTLHPLDESAARAIVGDLFDRLRPSVRRELLRRSEGNPLYLEELARSLQETIEDRAASVPGTVQGLLQSRIDRLDPALRSLIQMASVLGVRFSTGLLRKMYALEPQPIAFEAALEGIEAHGFLEPDGRDEVRGFRHALMQEVAYGGILLRLRKVLHESAARLGEQHFADRLEVEAPFFAHHFWEADLRVPAAPHLWRAGRAAALQYELHAAERFLERLDQVLEEHPDVLPEGAERARFLESYGTVLLDRGRYDRADVLFERLAELGDSENRTEWVGQALRGRGQIAMLRGHLGQAEAFYKRGLDRVQDSADRVRGDLHAGLGLVLYYRAHADEALEQHREALSLRERIHDRLGMAKSFINIGNALHALRDDLAVAQAHYENALTLTEEIGDRRLKAAILLNLGVIALERGDWEEALARLGEVEVLAEDFGWSFMRLLSLRNQAECRLALGQIERTIALLEICLHQGDEVLKAPDRVAVRLLLCRAYLSALDDVRAAEKLDDARRVAEEMELADQQDGIRLCEGRLSEARGEWGDAAQAFADALEAAERIGHPTVTWLARAHLARARAREGGPEVEPSPAEFPAHKPVAAAVAYLSADALASRALTREAAEALQAAGDLAADLGCLTLERAAFERLATVWETLGEDERRETALARAARAMANLEQHLPPDLREAFASHPRNTALRALAPI